MRLKFSQQAFCGLILGLLFGAASIAAQTFEVVRSLTAADGSDPQSGLVQMRNGDFAGTTVGGYGTLFVMDTWGRFATIHSFNGERDGANPHAPLLQGVGGSLYGTTMNGLRGWGSIFQWEPSGGLKTLLTFVPSTSGRDGEGARPHAPLFLSSNDQSSRGKFFGVTTRGGKDDLGTIFTMDADNDELQTIHHFSGFDGATPYEALTEFDGYLYGTTPMGGASNNGTIFRVDPKLPDFNFAVVHSFAGADGAFPQAGLIAVDGLLYGTTYGGGKNGMGTVFKVAPSGANFSVIHHFESMEGIHPHAALIQARNGQIYGTTSAGGFGTSYAFFGSVFRMNPDTAQNDFSIVHRFMQTDGVGAQARLIEASDGALYGTTAQGGTVGNGVVFRLVFVPVASITPSSGPASGGAAVAISGENFHQGAGLTIGGVDAGDVTIASDSSIAATAPALAPGTLNDVLVDNSDRTRGGILKGFFADFRDVPQGDIFHYSVERVFRNRITAGVGDGNFGRNSSATRAQMAVFLLKAKHGLSYAPPPATGTVFGDVPVSGRFASWIEQAYKEGITAGCNGGADFCPSDPMTRDQMAMALLKAKHGSSFVPPKPHCIFIDVECSSDFAPWIEELYNERITAGCDGGNRYCPTAPSTRGQTAVFLAKTFNLP